MTFIIRSQGFFYTDEYYAPGGALKQVVRETYKTKKEADAACAALIRQWLREEPIGNYLFDEEDRIQEVVDYMRSQWPDDDIRWDYELTIPDDATDQQVDEIVKRTEITFAQVFEVDGAQPTKADPAEDEDDDDEEDGDDDEEGEYPDDELHYGPSR